jgi:hypothetical protein
VWRDGGFIKEKDGIVSSDPAQLLRWTSWSPGDAVTHRVIIDFSSNGELPILAGWDYVGGHDDAP